MAALLDYESSLEDLTFNSKPIINMLTMMAGKNRDIADKLVELVEERVSKVAGRRDHPDASLTVSICCCVIQICVMFVCRIYCNKVTGHFIKKKREKATVSSEVKKIYRGHFLGENGVQATYNILDGFHDEEFRRGILTAVQ